MNAKNHSGRGGRRHGHKFWILGFFAVLWVALRSGMNGKRLSYPCQRAALPFAVSWLASLGAVFGSAVFLRRFARVSAAAILIAGLIVSIGTLPQASDAARLVRIQTPSWQVPQPLSRLFVYSFFPPSPGSLAAGDASVPDAYLSDEAIDGLLDMLEKEGAYFYKTAAQPNGMIGPGDVVIIKGNFQWTHRNTSSTDRIKGLIWRILNHPDGFSGDIIVCDNTQDHGTGINAEDDNSDSPGQSLLDVVDTFSAKGHPVYWKDWRVFGSIVAGEYADGDADDGYIYEPATKVSYPKFRSPSGRYYISLKKGIWDPGLGSYDASRLSIINVPVLKAHEMSGATEAVKNWAGVVTTARRAERFGGWDGMHEYFFGPQALLARTMAETFPKLTIVDATWTSTSAADNTELIQCTRRLIASTDPVAASWYAVKYILQPIAVRPAECDPEDEAGLYGACLANWTNYLRGAGFPCTKNPAEISVTVKEGDYSLSLIGTRKTDRGWLGRTDYVQIEFSPDRDLSGTVDRYVLYRKSPGGDFVSLQQIPAAGLVNGRYALVDKHLKRGTTYVYRLEAQAPGGQMISRSFDIPF